MKKRAMYINDEGIICPRPLTKREAYIATSAALGREGGLKTLETKGRGHYVRAANKRWQKWRKLERLKAARRKEKTKCK